MGCAAGLTRHHKPGGLQIAQLPGQQQAAKQHHRQQHAQRQSPRHVATTRVVRRSSGGRVAPVGAQQKETGCRKAGQYGKKTQGNGIRHGTDYGEHPVMRKRVNLQRVAALLLGGAGVVLGVALGLWQLDRAAQKTARHQAMQARAAAPALTQEPLQRQLQAGMAQGGDPLAALHYHPVTLQGTWLPAHAVYLNHRPMHGQPGFWLLMPLQLSGGAVVLVQRGWLPRHFTERLALAPVTTPAGTVTVHGWIDGAPARIFTLAAGDNAEPSDPRIRQNLDMAAYAQATGLPLWPITVVQTGAASEGLQRDWPVPDAKVHTHYGYAAQWLAMAAVLAGMLLWFQVWLPARRARREGAACAVPGAPSGPPVPANPVPARDAMDASAPSPSTSSTSATPRAVAAPSSSR